MNDSYIFCSYEIVLPHSRSTLLPKLTKTLYTSLVKLCLNFGAHHKNFISVFCCLQNCIHVLHPSQGQTGGIWRMLNLGCEQVSGEQPMLLQLPHICTSWC
jgi:hypothetical protein